MISSVDNCNNSVNFTASPRVLSKLAQDGIKRGQICASYIGYTGNKILDFPVVADLPKHNYPDVTEAYNAFVKNAIDTTKSNLGKNRVVNFYKKCKVFCQKLKTADEWDTKFMENFPGRDKNGNVQYALFKGRVVSANHISNYAYSELLYRLGIKKWLAVGAAKIYSYGVTNLIFDRALPSAKALTFKDTPQDQQTIRFAYEELSRGCKVFA